MSRETVGDEVRSGDLTVEGTVAADAATVSGNVGIGTSSPQYRLDVVGSSGSGARISNSGGLSGSAPSTTHAELIIDSADANLGIQILGTSTSDQRILFGDSSSSGAGSIRYNHAGDYLALSCAATERMRIDSAGLITGSGTSLGAWTAYTPTLASATGAIASYTSAGRYCRIGKIVHVVATFTITDNGTGATSLQSNNLPITSAASGLIYSGTGRETAATGKQLQTSLGQGSTTWQIFNYDNSYAGGTGYTLRVSLTYEAA